MREVREAFDEQHPASSASTTSTFPLHWPNPAQDRYVDAWRGLCRLLDEGLVRAIGVSNFKPAHLDRLLSPTGVAPE